MIRFIVGVLLLAKAADWLAGAAAQVADLTHLPRLILGATLVGLVTNIPEFAVSLSAVWYAHGTIAFGNPIGSNIVNTGLILGICLLRSRRRIEPAWLRDHGIPMLLACTLVFAFAAYRDITTSTALVLLALCAGYVVWSVVSAKREPELAHDMEALVAETLTGPKGLRGRWAAAGVLLALSAPLVIFSSRMVLSCSVEFAHRLNVSESIIALSLVAVGTSLPELATALAAFGRNHQDTAVGIVLGSNIYNALGVIGLSGVFGRLPVTLGNRLFDLPMMLLVLSVPMLPCLFGKTPGRFTGVILLLTYGFYTYSLFTLYGVFS